MKNLLLFFFSQPACFTVPLLNYTLSNVIKNVSWDTKLDILLKLRLVRCTVFSILENHFLAMKGGSLAYQKSLQPVKMCLLAFCLPVWL